MISEIRLNKKTKTIKVVNRKNNLRLQHTGKIGPIGPQGVKGEAGGFYISYIFNSQVNVPSPNGYFTLCSPFDLVCSNFDTSNTDVGYFLRSLEPTGRLEIFVLEDATKWSIGNYTKKVWAVDTAYVTGDLINHGADVYRVLQDHTSTTTDEPISGVNYLDYWVLLSPNSVAFAYNQAGTSYSFQGNEHMGISFVSDGEKGDKGDTGDTGISTFVRVHHGSDPDVPRPNAVYVEWVGSVAPNNATIEDTWIDTS